ncbi:hypothetical protein HHI36_013145 [Cryptolaemus montrouzieri]|uniref:Uncharacterized protein n=1 Tax=Cryptolaemus montrouzieri TaxID=559131 RepID=A0ABD2NGA4_9CUCU
MGENVEDKYISFVSMNSIKESYEVIIMMQQSRKSAPLSEEVKIASIEERNPRKLKGQDENFMALLSSGYNKKKPWKPWKKQANKGKVIRCYDCNTEECKRPDCPKRKGQSKENTSDVGKNNSEGSRSCSSKKETTLSTTALLSSSVKNKVWVFDSGTTNHMSPNREWMIDFSYNCIQEIAVADDYKVASVTLN